MTKRAYIYDLETYKNMFLACFIDILDPSERYSFEISNRVNEFGPLFDFLNTKVGLLVGFNNTGFDYPILHELLTKKIANPKVYYNKAQKIINSKQYPYKRVYIPQIDLYKIWHLDNRAKRTSLKQVEFFLRHPNLQELPYHPETNLSYKQMDDILEYCFNDCEATLKLYDISKEKISLRKTLSDLYKLDLYNSSDSSIGEQIFIKYMLNKKNIEFKELKASVGKPSDFNFNLGDVILPYVKFKSEEFNSAIEFFKSSNVESGILKDVFNYSVEFKGLKYDYGAGGLHASKNGIFETKGDYIIVDWDVASYYPNLAIRNKMFPQHLSEDFCDIYEEIYDTRKAAKVKAKKDKTDKEAVAVNAGLKLALNSLYGKSNSKYSVVYDPMYTAATCINGQLLLSMLAEWLSEFSEVFYVNTDGLTIRIHKSCLERMYNTCKKWEELTKLELESVVFKKMFLRDVNNLIAIDEWGGVKRKGAYEIDKAVGKEPAIWKNNSSRILPIAASEYFINNVPIEQTIKNHSDIYDFCKMGKVRGDWKMTWGESLMPKINRYYLSNNPSTPTLVKEHLDGRRISLEAHPDFKKHGTIYNCSVINNYSAKSDYNINYDYYIKEAEKLVSAINGN